MKICGHKKVLKLSYSEKDIKLEIVLIRKSLMVRKGKERITYWWRALNLPYKVKKALLASWKPFKDPKLAILYDLIRGNIKTSLLSITIIIFIPIVIIYIDRNDFPSSLLSSIIIVITSTREKRNRLVYLPIYT